MSVLQVYLSWANSVLCEDNRSVDNVAAVQDGKVLCELIDILAPDAALLAKIQGSGTSTQRSFIQTALDHMKNHGIQITFSTQDIIDGDIKSLLDVMWLLILNYGIHFIGENSLQRSVGSGKKALLEWCQGELEVAFDSKNTLAFSLCTGNWFTKLLQKFAGCHIQEAEDKVSYLYKLLQEIEERYGIRRTIISPNDIIDGTVDEHTLMIYLSLLKRRVSSTARSARREMLSVDGKEAAMARVEERNRSASEEAEKRRQHSEAVTFSQQHQLQQQAEGRPTRSSSVDSSPFLPSVRVTVLTRSQESVESDWLSSDTNSLLSGRDRSPAERGNFLVTEAEQVLLQTISERVKEHLPTSDRDEDKDTDASQGQSERETESMSEFSSGALDEGYVTLRKESSRSKAFAPKDKSKGKEQQTTVKKPAGKDSSSNGAKKSTESDASEAKAEKTVKIKIKRPKDYYLQWEETIDRLSHGPPAPPDVSDMSPRSPREILRGIEDIHSPRSRSPSSESDMYGGPYTPVWKRREYFEHRSGSLSPSSPGRFGYSRSRSLPSGDSPAPGMDRPTERRQSPSPSPSPSGRNKTKTSRQADGERRRENQQNGQASRSGERRSPTENGQRQDDSGSRPEVPTQAEGVGSNFMERLEELKRSGRAQRVILPDLGPDAPVLMIPGQGEEVLLLFDALRQARLEVNLNMPRANGATNGVSNGAANGSKSPARTSPTQTSEETELKKVTRSADAAGGTATRKSPTQEENKDTVGRLPRPTPPRHRMPKPTDIRVEDLRSGRVGEQRRAQSLTALLTTSQAVSPLVSASNSSRYHSLSPRRDQSLDQTDSAAPSPAVRNGIALRGSGGDRALADTTARKTFTGSRDSLSYTIHRSYDSSPVAFRPSPTTSPLRQAAVQNSYHSPSPLRVISPRSSPRFGGTPERLPPLELPEDLTSPRHRVSSPQTRVGGLGRVPRREAWERQRQRKDPRPFDASGADSMAQAKFIEVLCKEIEELKQKIEVMEDSQAESSPERSSPVGRRPATAYTSTSTGQSDTFYTTRSEIQETESKMLLAPREGSPSVAVQKARQSPRPWEAARSSSTPPSTSPRLRPSVSPRQQYSRDSPTVDRTRGRQSPSPDRSRALNLSPRRTQRDEASLSIRFSGTPGDSASQAAQTENADANTSGRVSPGRSGRGGISLGYKSPIRSVTQEIWGKDLTSVEGLEPNRHVNYKRLISQQSLGEEDVIELKQSLASSVVENDILQAKLNNARHEIQDKLSKTNEVLDDCRRHLAKSQAENMELRTALEREKERAETGEGRVRDLQLIVQQARADNEELEGELDHTLSILDRSKPGIDALKEENAQLQGRASVIQNENCSLKREMDDLRKNNFKSVSTIRELRDCLDEVRRERSDMQQRLNKLERSQNESKLKSMVGHYNQEKGAKDETEREYSSSGVSSSSERFRPSPHLRRSSTRNEELTPRATPSKTTSTPNVSGITSLSPSPGRGLNYSYEEPPTVPSSYREIYPHRKPRYQSLSAERHSPVTFIDYSDLQHYPTKLDQMDSEDDDYLASNPHEDSFGTPRSRDSSPIYKPIPYRPYSSENKSSTSAVTPEKTTETERESRARSPQTRGRSPVRKFHTFRQSRSISSSPARGMSKDRHNRSYDSVMFDLRKQRSASSSPGRFGDARKGILKNGTAAGRSRDRSSSPRYGVRSHSPPTRLSPEDKKDNPVGKKKLVFTRTEAGQIARDLQREFDKEDCLLDELRKKHSSKSWFELQLEDPARPSGVELAETLGEEHVLLSEQQRTYANELIKKYTGLKL